EVEGREDDDAHRPAARADPLGREDPPRRLDPVELGHAQVHEDDVGLEVGDESHRLVAVTGLADDLQVGLGVDDRAHAGPEELLVVDEQDPDGWGGRRAHRRISRARTGTQAVAVCRSRPSPPSGCARRRTSRRPPTPSSRRRMPSSPCPSTPGTGWVVALATSIRRSSAQCTSTTIASSRTPRLSALVSISCSTRNATTSSSGGSGRGVPSWVRSTCWPVARTPSTRDSQLPGGGGGTPSRVLASTPRTSRSDWRAAVATWVSVCRIS